MSFVGDDWAEDHHDVELVDEHVKVRAKQRSSRVVSPGLPGGCNHQADDKNTAGDIPGEGRKANYSY